VAQICHNAQVYNRPSAPIFGAAVRLREVFKQKLQELVQKGQITTEDAKIPDLGELPPVEESPLVSTDEDSAGEEEDEEEEEEDDEEEDSDEDIHHRLGRGRGRASASGRRDRAGDGDEDAHKKRGPPPSVLTPTEARIYSILKGLRKFKADDGSPLILPFERLPDKAIVPDYYQTITNPIALDSIRKKAKRKKYQNVDHLMADIGLMFGNAKLYNEDDSPVYQAAVELQKQADVLAAEEKARPDEDFRDEDGRLPLSHIDYNGEAWRVGKFFLSADRDCVSPKVSYD
jgi:chromatin structure-remodeling complex subunit RSC1/2